MSDDEAFLSRWSRRKRGVSEPTVENAAEPATTPPAEAETVAAVSDEVDLSHLPPVEEIDALTDITQFLARGVPAALQQAALRRVWTADPAIRDFIEVAENQWDFASGAIPGFGPLEPEAAFDSAGRAIASRLTPLSGDTIEQAPKPESTLTSEPTGHSEPAPETVDIESQAEALETAADNATDVSSEQQNEGQAVDKGIEMPRSRHGSALPA